MTDPSKRSRPRASTGETAGLDWSRLLDHEGFKILKMTQDVSMRDGFTFTTTRCPIRIDGERLYSAKGSPALGEDNDRIRAELLT